MDLTRSIESLYSVAYAFLEGDRLRDAANAFRVMVRFAPLDERAWLGLGECHEKAGENDIASELYGAGAAVASPPSARCLIALARICRRNGDSDAAEEHYEAAAVIAEDHEDDELLALVRAEEASS
jgi:Tfp pilus assembly protein PilF